MAFKCSRWTVANILPIAFVIWVIFTVWFLHAWLHLLTLLQIGSPPEQLDEAARRRGEVELVVSQSLTLLLVICFLRAVCTDPGSVPQTPDWMSERRGSQQKQSKSAASSGEESEHLLAEAHCLELKQSGERRFCKWCDGYKPDRCHHCRICKSCILRMDHHCPWIANCVGFGNHKYFFLLVLYALLNAVFIVVTMSETVFNEMPPMHRFLLVFCMTLAGVMGVLLMLFFSMHVWLMLSAMTTIEFCETRHKQAACAGAGPLPSYDLGAYSNLCSVLGERPHLWLLPLAPPAGDGLFFRTRRPRRREPGAGEDRGAAPEKLAAGAPGCDALAPEVTGARAAMA